jgi:hypothetical protein
MAYTRGHVIPWWDDQFKKLNYLHDSWRNDLDIKRWNITGYHGMKYEGGVYSMQQDMPKYAEPFFTLFEWDHVTLSFFRMKTSNILPMHKDYYNKYSELYNIKDRNLIIRAIVFLEDWKSGHCFEIDNTPITQWRAGDWVSWLFDTPHMAANIGVEDRYTLQITGVSKK